jgi:hypothetical protein
MRLRQEAADFKIGIGPGLQPAEELHQQAAAEKH